MVNIVLEGPVPASPASVACHEQRRGARARQESHAGRHSTRLVGLTAGHTTRRFYEPDGCERPCRRRRNVSKKTCSQASPGPGRGLPSGVPAERPGRSVTLSAGLSGGAGAVNWVSETAITPEFGSLCSRPHPSARAGHPPECGGYGRGGRGKRARRKSRSGQSLLGNGVTVVQQTLDRRSSRKPSISRGFFRFHTSTYHCSTLPAVVNGCRNTSRRLA